MRWHSHPSKWIQVVFDNFSQFQSFYNCSHIIVKKMKFMQIKFIPCQNLIRKFHKGKRPFEVFALMFNEFSMRKCHCSENEFERRNSIQFSPIKSQSLVILIFVRVRKKNLQKLWTTSSKHNGFGWNDRCSNVISISSISRNPFMVQSEAISHSKYHWIRLVCGKR